MKVCHLTSAHPNTDIRIFHKECVSLSKAGYDVYFVARGESKEENGVHIIGCGEPNGRKDRMTGFAKKIVEKALSLNCDIYHFHDPELIIYANKFKKSGKKVIFDSHEDVTLQIMDKIWIPSLLRKGVSLAYSGLERICSEKIDAIVTTTPHIYNKFSKFHSCVVVVKNYPIIKNAKKPIPYRERKLNMGYTGVNVTEDRGIKEMCLVAGKTGEHLDVYGKIVPSNLCDNIKYDDNVVFHGLVPYEELQADMDEMKIGFLIEYPTANAVNALCIKMFEYMLHGIPIIYSNIPLWQEVVDDAGCGISVNPHNIDEIAEAVKKLTDDVEYAEKLGMNGYKAVIEKYSWENEAKTLIELYRRL